MGCWVGWLGKNTIRSEATSQLMHVLLIHCSLEHIFTLYGYVYVCMYL